LIASTQSAKFAKLPQFIEKGKNHWPKKPGPHFSTTGRVSKIHSPSSGEIYISFSSIWTNFLDQLFYGPVKNVELKDTEELCSFALEDITSTNLTEWNDGTFCENYFCRPSNSIPFFVQRLRSTPPSHVNYTRYQVIANSVYSVFLKFLTDLKDLSPLWHHKKLDNVWNFFFWLQKVSGKSEK
jgi:hypothetical protein